MTRDAAELLEGLETESRVECTFLEAGNFLRYHKIPYIELRLARSPSEAARLASSFGFPVVLKLVSPKILHKSECGGVLLGLQDERAVRKGFLELMATGKRIVVIVSFQPVVGVENECRRSKQRGNQ